MLGNPILNLSLRGSFGQFIWIIPALSRANSIYLKKCINSGSPGLTAAMNCEPAYGFSRSANASICSRVMARGSRNFSSASSACAARSLASLASFTANPRLSLDQLLSSVWIRLSHILNRTSPIMPIAMAISGQIDSVRNHSYGGSRQAMTSSAATAVTTNAPQHMAHLSHDDDDRSNSGSRAFFIPFGKYHAGKGDFRTFFLALAFWALIWAAIFAWWWHLGWFQ